MSTPTDPLYPRQSHLDQIGDIEAVWDDYTGRGVRVAVYDFGMDVTHPDLAVNYSDRWHFRFDRVTQDGLPDDPDRAHGTAIGGIIAAAADGVGTVGVAHDARVTSVELDPLFDNWDIFRAGFYHAAQFDVMNNSWGLTAPFWSDDLNLAIPGSTAQRLEAVFAEVAVDGRGGLGTVIVQAAGNDAYDANADGMLAIRYSILVGAHTLDGVHAPYSNASSGLLVTAPAAAVATDIQGDNGYNAAGSNDGDRLDPDYTSEFGGTSAAAAVVSGVVALMLEANPDLGWRDVQQILALSADRNRHIRHSTDPDYVQTIAWNGGRMQHMWLEGFGEVDARAAVRMAEAWSVLSPTAKTSANEVHVVSHSDQRDVPIIDANQFGPSFSTIGGSGFVPPMVVETMMVTIALEHTYANDLSVYLSGSSTFNISSNFPGTTLLDSGLIVTFKVEAWRGLIWNGRWSIDIQDAVPGDTGVIRWARLDVYGSQSDVNDIHTYTDDFLEVVSANNNRQKVNDVDGGIDWFNFSSVTGNIATDTGRIEVNGYTWVNDSAANVAAIENMYAGDGDDEIMFGATANHIIGARGNDTLSGGGGDDTLDGGMHRDSLRGGDGLDILSGGSEADRLFGDTDADTIHGDEGDDVLDGGSGDDVLDGGDGNDRLFGADGADKLSGQAGNDTLSGSAGNDTFAGMTGDDRIYGEDGADGADGGQGNDSIDGGSGNDSLRGGGNDDDIRGGSGNDDTRGGAGNDSLWGGADSDTLFGEAGDDLMFGGDDDDDASGGGGSDQVSGDAGNDSLAGGSGNDTLLGGAGADSLSGNDGNDSLAGDGGDDSIAGWAGRDDLVGGQGGDSLSGGEGNDRLDGSAGSDELTGGRGADIFFFRLGSGRDVITDFRDDTDAVRLDHNLWLAQGDLTARQVVQTFGSIDAQGHLVLDFGADVLVIAGLGTLQSLYDDLRII